ENRVGLIPACVRELTRRGHEVIVEQGAGQGIGATDAHYRNAGARIEADVDALFRAAELIVKVKEPLQVERKRLSPGQALFTYLHLAADKVLTDEVVQSGATSIAYETVTSPEGGLPLLAPMSEIAGRMSVQQPPIAWKRIIAERAFCWAARLGSNPATSSYWAGALSGPMRRPWRWGLAQA